MEVDNSLVSGLSHSTLYEYSDFATAVPKRRWKKSTNGMKLRLLLMGCILIILGAGFYFERGVADALILAVIGIVLLVGGIIYPNPVKQKEVAK